MAHLLGTSSDEASAAWRTRYDELSNDIRPFPFAKELVERLRSNGLKVALATSSPSDLLRRAMRAAGIEGLIDAVTTADDVTSSKPDPAVFEVAMRMAGIDPEFAIAVGDSVWDVKAARAAGIACVAVESGGFSRHELSEEGAVAVYRDVEELWRQLSTSPLAGLALSSGRPPCR
ncbi:MAG: HAD family hydrolase [Acidimicrobiales bacterium]